MNLMSVLSEVATINNQHTEQQHHNNKPPRSPHHKNHHEPHHHNKHTHAMSPNSGHSSISATSTSAIEPIQVPKPSLHRSNSVSVPRHVDTELNTPRSASVSSDHSSIPPLQRAGTAHSISSHKSDSINRYNIDPPENDAYPKLAIPPWLPDPLPANMDHNAEYIERQWNNYHTSIAVKIGVLGDYVEAFVRSHPLAVDSNLLNDNTRNARIRGFIIYDARIKQWHKQLVPHRVTSLTFFRNYAAHCSAIIDGHQAFATHKQYMSSPVDEELGPTGSIGSIHFQHTLSALKRATNKNKSNNKSNVLHSVSSDKSISDTERSNEHKNALSRPSSTNELYSGLTVSQRNARTQRSQVNSHQNTHRDSNNHTDQAPYTLSSMQHLFDEHNNNTHDTSHTDKHTTDHHTNNTSDDDGDLSITDVYDRQQEYIKQIEHTYSTASLYHNSTPHDQKKHDAIRKLLSLGHTRDATLTEQELYRKKLKIFILKALSFVILFLYMIVAPIVLMLVFYLDIVSVVESGVVSIIAPIIVWFISFYRLKKLPNVITYPTLEQRRSWGERIDIYLQWIWLISQDYVYESYHLCVTLLACGSYLWYSYTVRYAFDDPVAQTGGHYYLSCTTSARLQFIQVEYFLTLSLAIDYIMRFISSPN